MLISATAKQPDGKWLILCSLCFAPWWKCQCNVTEIRLPAKHYCYVCGRSAFWSESWQAYGSMRDLEDFGFCIKTCSEACRNKLPEIDAVYQLELAELGERPKSPHRRR